VSPTSGRPDLGHLIQIPKFLDHRPGVVRPIRGRSPSGELVDDDVVRDWTLLLFLSSTCDGCQEIWDSVADPDRSTIPSDLTTVVVTRSATERPEAVARLCGTAKVVMSDEAWPDYGVHSGPFFVLVDGRQKIVATEGVAWAVEQITAAVGTARAG
jgi:hypothetical protein